MDCLNCFPKRKGKKKVALGQGDGGLGAGSKARSSPPPVAPAVDTSTAALGSNQAGAHTSTLTQPSNKSAVSNEPTKGSHPESIRQEATAKASTLKSDTVKQNIQAPGDVTKSSEISISKPKREETKPASRPLGERIRDGAIIALDFASIISEATDLLKPVKAVAGGIKKVLEITKVYDSLSTLFTYLLIKNTI
jgi:hypothetical protein